MAIAFDAVSTTNTFGASAAAKTVSLTIGSGSNRMVIALIGIDNNGGFSPTPTFNGQTMTLAGTANNGILYVYIYYILEANLPAAGSYILSIDPVTAGSGGIWCVSLSGVAQQAPEATGTGNNAGSVASWSNSVTTLTANAMAVDISMSYDRTFTPSAGQTERADFKDSTAYGMCGSTKPIAAVGASSLGWTPDVSAPYAQFIAAFAEYVAPTSNPNPVAVSPYMMV